MSPSDGGQRPGQFISLLGSDEAQRDERRDDALSASAHSRLDRIELPRDDFDLRRARGICGEIVRDLLLDFSPALILLPSEHRLRVQALLAYARTLFDFTRDRALAGERLSQINRWQFALDQSLDGDTVGQPVFVAMSAIETTNRWPRQRLDELASIARGRISSATATTTAELDDDLRRMTRSIAAVVVDEPLPPGLGCLGAALIRTHSLLGDESGLDLRRPDLFAGLPPNPHDPPHGPRTVIEAECRRLTHRLRHGNDIAASLPAAFRHPTRFATRAALELLRQAEAGQAPGLGPWRRIALLARARLS